MSKQMLKQIRRTIDKFHMLDIGDGVVVAVSGGPDSVALLSILEKLSEEYKLRLIVAHLNHGLRPGPADEDEDFVRQLCLRSGLICETKKIDAAFLCRRQNRSVEETARQERYRFLEEIRHRHQARKIALGHHAGDQTETVLMNLLRGSGREGLRGMQHIREGRYIRPLLGVTRVQINEYLELHHLPYRIDLSNADENFLRNTMRRRLIPELRARYNPRIEANLCRTAEILGREDDYLRAVVEKHDADTRIVRKDAGMQETRIIIPAFLELHEALQYRLIKKLLLEHAPKKQGIGYVHVCDVKALMQSVHPGASLHLPFGMEARREYDVLILCQCIEAPHSVAEAMQIHENVPADCLADGMIARDIGIPGVVRIETQNMMLSFDFVERSSFHFDDSRTIYMDYACIVPPLVVRTPRKGDRIQPLGMCGTKKLKHYFIDKKLPVRLRSRIPLLVDGHSVICIIRHLLSERVKISEKTNKILRIEISEII
jgi:tRNA(Ile)-lysidine synthase